MDRVVHPPPRLLYTHSSPFCFRKQPSLGQQLRHFRRKDDVPARAFVLRGGQLVDPLGFAAPLVSGCVFRRTCTRIRRRSISRSIGWAACFLFRPQPLVNALPSFLLVDFVVGCELDRSKKPNPGKSLPQESRCTYSPGRGSTEEGSRCEYSQGAGGTFPPRVTSGFGGNPVPIVATDVAEDERRSSWSSARWGAAGRRALGKAPTGGPPSGRIFSPDRPMAPGPLVNIEQVKRTEPRIDTRTPIDIFPILSIS